MARKFVEVSLDDVIEGVVLAIAITAPGGSVILPAGAVLNKEIAGKLGRYNIKSVFVFQDLSDDEQHRLIEQVNHRFRQVEHEPLMQALKEEIQAYRRRNSTEFEP